MLVYGLMKWINHTVTIWWNSKAEVAMFSAYSRSLQMSACPSYNMILRCCITFHPQHLQASKALYIIFTLNLSGYIIQKSMMFHFGNQKKPKKCANDDTGHMALKTILIEFRINLPTDFTSVGCSWHAIQHTLTAPLCMPGSLLCMCFTRRQSVWGLYCSQQLAT